MKSKTQQYKELNNKIGEEFGVSGRSIKTIRTMYSQGHSFGEILTKQQEVIETRNNYISNLIDHNKRTQQTIDLLETLSNDSLIDIVSRKLETETKHD